MHYRSGEFSERGDYSGTGLHALDSICAVRYILRMVEVIGTDEFETWYLSLEADETRAVNRLVDLLAEAGLRLGHPYSSAVKLTRYPIRELRHRSTSHPLRIFYAFDPARNAVLLVGGNKKGDDRFYERMVPIAERVWEQYLREQKH